MSKLRVAVAFLMLNLVSCQTFLNSDIENKLPYIKMASFLVTQNSLNNSKHSEKSILAAKQVSLALNALVGEMITPDQFKISISKDAEINATVKSIAEGLYIIYKAEFDKIKDGNYKNIVLIVKSIAEGVDLSAN